MENISSDKLEQCVLDLHKVGVVKFGDFTLKSGMQSPVYFDLRIITSFPKLMCTVSELLWSVAPGKKYDHVCGVAYTGIPLATVISQKEDLPMVVRRKESKTYGTKKLVEGVFSAGEECLIVEDVLVSGTSVYETVETLRDLELRVTDAVVFLDRQQGGLRNLEKLGVTIIPVVTLTQMLTILRKYERVTATVEQEVMSFIADNNKTTIVTQQQIRKKDNDPNDRVVGRYSDRAANTTNPLSRRLFNIMDSKQSNLCVAADVDTAQDLLDVAEKVGPYICLLKTHADTLPDFTSEVAAELQRLGKQHNFLLFEDKKFVDIGATVSRQYRQQARWAHLVTAAPVLGGDGVIRGIADGMGEDKEKGVVLVAEMSSEGALRSPAYLDACRKMAVDHPHLVTGFVSQSSLTSDPRMLQMTPGVNLTATGDSLGQRYVSPECAVLERSADVIIVGRGVTKADNRAAAAKLYQQHGYNAYLCRQEQASSAAATTPCE